MALVLGPMSRAQLMALLVSIVVNAGTAAADSNDKEDVYAAARAALSSDRVAKTEAVGFSIQKTPFSEAPAEGGVLVGFDIALAKVGKDEAIVGLRPIYRTRQGEISSQEYGLFRTADTGTNKKFARKQVIRSTRVSANTGYAVGAITLRTAIGIRGMSLTFMRIKGQALDPRDSYTSGWIGSDSGGREASLNCNGAPVVGVFGNQDERQVLALGLFYVSDGAHAAPSAPATQRTQMQPRATRTQARGPSKLDRFKELIRQDEANAANAEPEKPAPADAAPIKQADERAAAVPAATALDGEPPVKSQPIWENWKVIVPAGLACLVVSLFGVKRLIATQPKSEQSALYHQDVAEALLPPGATRPKATTPPNAFAGLPIVNTAIILAVGVAAALVAYEVTKGQGKTPGPGSFREFVSEAGKFRVEMPGSPTEETMSAVGIPLIMFRVEEKDGAYGVAYADIPMIGGATQAQLQQGLDSARVGMVANVRGKFLGESPIRLDGKYPGREVRAELPIPDGIFVGRIYIVNSRLYMVVVTGLSRWVHSANAKRFLDSLEVTP